MGTTWDFPWKNRLGNAHRKSPEIEMTKQGKYMEKSKSMVVTFDPSHKTWSSFAGDQSWGWVVSWGLSQICRYGE
jgi:hypothetical protein